MSRSKKQDQTTPPRFGYEASLWGLVGAGLIAIWLLRWGLLTLLPDQGWADPTATAVAVVVGAGTVGLLARCWNSRRSKGCTTPR